MCTFKLIERENMQVIIPFLRMLNDTADEKILAGRLDEMLQQGYACVGIYDKDKLVGISGLWIIIKYLGKYIEPDDVIILPEYRNLGIGQKLMEWIHAYGKSRGCTASELNCYVTSAAAQKFWMNNGYKIIGFHFQKEI